MMSLEWVWKKVTMVCKQTVKKVETEMIINIDFRIKKKKYKQFGKND